MTAKRKEAPELHYYSGKFSFEGLGFRKLRNGNKVRVILEAEYNDVAMSALATLVDSHVEVAFQQYVPEPVESPDEKEQGKLGIEG
jgi:hypothetical protein